MSFWTCIQGLKSRIAPRLGALAFLPGNPRNKPQQEVISSDSATLLDISRRWMHSREFWDFKTHSHKWYFGVALSGGVVLSEAVGAAGMSVARLRRSSWQVPVFAGRAWPRGSDGMIVL